MREQKSDKVNESSLYNILENSFLSRYESVSFGAPSKHWNFISLSPMEHLITHAALSRVAESEVKYPTPDSKSEFPKYPTPTPDSDSLT